MNKASYKAIKLEAKERMKGHFGEMFLALAVVPFIFSFASSIFSLIFVNLEVIGYIVQFFITVLTQYIGIMLVLKLSKGNFHDLFDNFFGNSKGYLNMLVYLFLMNILFVLPLFLYIDFFKDLTDYFNSLPVSSYPQPGELGNIIHDFLPSVSLIILSAVLSFIGFIIGIKLFFTPYLIVDKEMKAIDAIKLSWYYSKENFFRILFFPFSFILWYLLFFITCGLILIYVIPYATLSMAHLYKAILIENDNYSESIIEKDTVQPVDPLAEEDSEDPFDSYYE